MSDHSTKNASEKNGSAIRWDIQVLRGWAIALVIIDHAKLPVFKGGFLGVDIFFVVSGFLMTGLIIRAIERKTFSLADFYARRARRLLPAAYSTIILTSLVAPFLLDPHEFSDFYGQVIGAFTFTVNYVLWDQINYFDNLAALKPLLHIWSLSLEEQYYLVIPVLLLICPRMLRMPLGLVLTIASFALCLYMVERSPSAAFYFLPTRAWELGLGSLTAILIERRHLQLHASFARLLRWLCVAVLVVVPVIFDATGHPGLAAILVCLATAYLMAVPSALRKDGPWALPVWVGDRSYSLYLLHWPLFAFANNTFLNEPGLVTRLVLVVACVVGAELQYRMVEMPYRHRPLSRSYMAWLIAVPVVVVASLSAVLLFSVRSDADDFRTANVGLSRACMFESKFEERLECQSSPNPAILVWGDSFAMHVVPAVASSTSQGMVQATQPVCGPFMDIAPVDGRLFSESWAKNCIAFNDSVLDYLMKHPEIKTVALSSALTQYFGEAGRTWELLIREGADFRRTPAGTPELRTKVMATVERLRALGKKVILFAPPPTPGFDMGRCLQRRIEGYLLLPLGTTCNFTRADFQRFKQDIITFVDSLAETPGLTIVRFDDIICGTGECRSMIDGVPLYRDKEHLSVIGSRWLGQRLDLKSVLDN